MYPLSCSIVLGSVMNCEPLDDSLAREVVDKVLTDELATTVRVNSLNSNAVLCVQPCLVADELRESFVLSAKKRLLEPAGGIIEEDKRCCNTPKS